MKAVLCIISILVLASCNASFYTIPMNEGQDAWQISTPEAQGMDSGRLSDMLQYIGGSGSDVHGVLIIRNGVIVLEAYRYPYTSQTRHMLASCTKSFTATLVGIAIDKGYINGLDQPVLEVFKDRTFANTDGRKSRMAVRHLLSMSSGLDWVSGGPEDATSKMNLSTDWLGFVLDKPMAYEPGSFWIYNNGTSHVLSEIIEKTTGMSTFEFGRRFLFGPLGISNLMWERNAGGSTIGCAGLYMKPRDMAKLGLLYLNKGVWNGKRIVSTEWIEEASRPQAHEPYGFQWWVDSDLGLYRAWGYGGQHIAVLPSQNMVVVFTGGVKDGHHFEFHQRLYHDYILPAAVSNRSLPENALASQRLAAEVLKMSADPQAKPISTLPALAARISGRTFRFPANASGIERLSLKFVEGESQAEIAVKKGFIDGSFPLGLDGRYRVSSITLPFTGPYASVAFRGEWFDRQTFIIDLLNVDFGYRYRYTCSYLASGVSLAVVAVIEGISETIDGR